MGCCPHPTCLSVLAVQPRLPFSMFECCTFSMSLFNRSQFVSAQVEPIPALSVILIWHALHLLCSPNPVRCYNRYRRSARLTRELLCCRRRCCCVNGPVRYVSDSLPRSAAVPFCSQRPHVTLGPVALSRTGHQQCRGLPTTASPNPAWALPWWTLPGWERGDTQSFSLSPYATPYYFI